jgi:adenylate cyclase
MRIGISNLKIALAIGLAASLAAFILWRTQALEPIEAQATDLLMRMRGPAPADSRVVICDLDAASIDRYGRVPWPRSRMAALIDRLSAEGAKVIALDMIFSEPSPAAEDQALADAIARSGRVVLGYFFRMQSPKAQPVFASQAHPDNITGSAVEQSDPRASSFIPRRPAVEPNLDLFAEAAHFQGFFSHERESGVLRHYSLLINYRESSYPALALQAVGRYLRVPLALTRGRDLLPQIHIGEQIAEADEFGSLWVNYRGPSGTFRTVPAVEVLEGHAPAGSLRDRLVFVGSSETGVGDFSSSPFDEEVPGVEVHATVADNLLNRRYIYDGGLQVLVSLLALFFLGPLVALLVVVVERHLYGSLLAILLVLAWPLGCYLTFVASGWHLQIVSPMAAGAVALVGALRFRIGHVEKTSRQIKSTFQHYVSKAVVEEMLLHPERVKLGEADRREMTVLFCDIRGFTSISESLEPQALVQLLNEFFTPMTRIILDHGGTLDKYMGDALMAFFGAPLEQPDHAARACRAALAMRDELSRLNAHWREKGRLGQDLSLGIGIGLNSGLMSVGNVGSEEVFGYTVIGDNVNLGSRLEGLNKDYGTQVIVSEFTARKAGDGLFFRELDSVRVKGKRQPVKIYELLDVVPADPRNQDRAERFAPGLAAYRTRDFAAAEAIFADLAERLGDGPAKLFSGRCRKYQEEPPPDDWDGVEVRISK